MLVTLQIPGQPECELGIRYESSHNPAGNLLECCTVFLAEAQHFGIEVGPVNGNREAVNHGLPVVV